MLLGAVQGREAGVKLPKLPKVLVELSGLCIRSDSFAPGGPHVSRQAVSLQRLEVSSRCQRINLQVETRPCMSASWQSACSA